MTHTSRMEGDSTNSSPESLHPRAFQLRSAYRIFLLMILFILISPAMLGDESSLFCRRHTTYVLLLLN